MFSWPLWTRVKTISSKQLGQLFLEGGALRPLNKISRYLKLGRSGGGQKLVARVFDLPGRAESKVALHLLDRRGHPSSKEGNKAFSNCSNSFTPQNRGNNPVAQPSYNVRYHRRSSLLVETC